MTGTNYFLAVSFWKRKFWGHISKIAKMCIKYSRGHMYFNSTEQTKNYRKEVYFQAGCFSYIPVVSFEDWHFIARLDHKWKYVLCMHLEWNLYRFFFVCNICTCMKSFPVIARHLCILFDWANKYAVLDIFLVYSRFLILCVLCLCLPIHRK